ncbi:pyridoxal phosphate-dependent decarboxylase family protein [Cellulomonas fengjieae]|uniref:Pyridoxal-dependent decarboxylase n=1 Tax=Cellulomonas fengjieae TaxID=2819978 RepID=A0ABS3SKK0_9CELL|nr:pyridoxal-dependent decarboxylase [Cellulomonas fengjieae]MBO3086192.1 pyridoxal-dependent decarboxylase [Cellulomonas fengjieae]QVI68041.1 pyridoxal-dependent decarboxylase [Cellulomonas fengjieae]
MRETVDRLAGRLRSVPQPFSGASRTQLQALVDAVDLDAEGLGTATALREADDLVGEHAVWFHHPAYSAHLNCPVAVPAVVAEAIIAAVNPSLDTYDQSTVGTLMERKLVDWTCGRIGFAAGDGVFTSGGTQSNLQALLLAREAAAAAGARTDALVIVATASSHFSVQKSARLLGLGDEAVLLVRTDAQGRMDPAALAGALDTLAAIGRVPMCVVATAGTTDRGRLDPLAAIADECDRAGVWLHVDAAYGCGLLVSPTRRHLLAGIERARSVTVDFHKSFFQPVSSSAVLVREPADLRHVTWHADYLNPADADEPNQVDKSLQTTRRFDALKLWTTLRALGADGIGAMFDTVLDLAARVHDELERDPDLELVGRTDLSTVLFRYQPLDVTDEQADRLVPLVRRVLFESGRAIVAKTVVDGRPCLKLTLLNPDTTLDDVRAVLELVRGAGAALAEGDDLVAAEQVGAR